MKAIKLGKPTERGSPITADLEFTEDEAKLIKTALQEYIKRHTVNTEKGNQAASLLTYMEEEQF